jgi:predicted amidophosphoribosyltransferase
LLVGDNLSDEVESSKIVCAVCGLGISPDKDVCPRCGNVFHKDRREWDWNLIPRRRKLKETESREETVEEAGHD